MLSFRINFLYFHCFSRTGPKIKRLLKDPKTNLRTRYYPAKTILHACTHTFPTDINCGALLLFNPSPSFCSLCFYVEISISKDLLHVLLVGNLSLKRNLCSQCFCAQSSTEDTLCQSRTYCSLLYKKIKCS